MTHGTHGTRRCYRLGCRCLPCRASNAQYVADLRIARIGYPDPAERVDALPVRGYLLHLQRLGIGYRRAAELAGLDPMVILDIRMGRKAEVRADTATRILGIRPALAHGQAVPSWRTWRLLDSLLGEGFSKADLARRLGYKGLHIRFKRVRGKVRVENALRVRRLWEMVMAEDGAVLEIERKDE